MSKNVDTSSERYPGFDVLRQQDYWDEATRRLVLDRLHNIPPIRFFSPQEVETLQAVVDALMPQDDRTPERRIPIVPFIDDEQFRGENPGYRYEDMPDYRTAWRWGLEGINQTSEQLYGNQFVELGPDEKRAVLGRIQQGDAPGKVWDNIPAGRFFGAVLMRAVLDVYYAHPYPWNEIGYGGPAYPRGYYALNHGVREHWEAEERR